VQKLDRRTGAALLALPELAGDANVLTQAARRLPDFPEIRRALAQLRAIASEMRSAGAKICFDLGELRGLHYHSGVVFAVYAEGCANALALGGRYDEVGQAFGRARPATGFSMDLRDVLAVAAPAAQKAAILAPYRPRDAALQRRIAALRKAGEIVIVDLPGHEKSRGELGCDRRLRRVDGGWKAVKI
jgi:ATP phosphoribosyltransferase regulatory subunit